MGLFSTKDDDVSKMDFSDILGGPQTDVAKRDFKNHQLNRAGSSSLTFGQREDAQKKADSIKFNLLD